MTALAGPLHLVALVLVISGIQKLLAPQAASTAMRTAGLPRVGPLAGSLPGTLLGIVEVLTGGAAIAWPSAWATGWLAAFYLALAGFVVVLGRRDATAGCGCFGASSAPPGTAHLVGNLLSAAVALAATVGGVPDIVDVVTDIGVAVPYVILLTTGAALVLLGPALSATLTQITRGGLPRRFGLR